MRHLKTTFIQLSGIDKKIYTTLQNGNTTWLLTRMKPGGKTRYSERNTLKNGTKITHTLHLTNVKI